jgi:hypothetical protein
LTTTDDRPKAAPNSVNSSPPKDEQRKGAAGPVSNSPGKEDRPKATLNPLVPLHEAIMAAGPGEVWNKVADSLNPLLQDWQSYAHSQKWDRLARNLAAATAIAAGMSLLWDRGKKFIEPDAESEGR